MKQMVTELRVIKNDKGHNVWMIIRCDENENIIGEITACGVPARASELPVGAKFRTVFTVPKEKK